MIVNKTFVNKIVKSLLLMGFMTITAIVSTPAYSEQSDRKVESLLDQLAIAKYDQAEKIRTTIWSEWLNYETETIGKLTKMAMIHFSKGSLVKAESAFSKIIEIDPSFVEGWNKRATIRYMLGNTKGSLEDISEVLRRQPRHFGAISGKGIILYQSENYLQAFNTYKTLLKIDPNNKVAKQMYQRLKSILGEYT